MGNSAHRMEVGMSKRRTKKRAYEVTKRCRCARKDQCAHHWWLRVFSHGTRQRVDLTTLFPEDAVEVAAAKAKDLAKKGQIVNGQLVRPRADARPTLREVADAYQRAYPTRGHHYLRAFRSLIGDATALDDITTTDIRRMLTTWLDRDEAKRGVKGGAHAERQLAGVARHLFNWAVDEGYTDRSPFYKDKWKPIKGIVTKKKAIVARKRRLQDGEAERIRAHADPFLLDFFTAMLETGCRPGELRTLQWSEVKTDHFVVLATKAKDRDEREVPIEPTLRAILDRRRVGPDGQPLPDDAYVFGDAVGHVIKRERLCERWRVLCVKAKVPGLHLHDLRREFASQLVESGVTVHGVRDALGHANVTMTNTYLGLKRGDVRRAYQQRTAHRATIDPRGSMPPSDASSDESSLSD
jgi:integrase